MNENETEISNAILFFGSNVQNTDWSTADVMWSDPDKTQNFKSLHVGATVHSYSFDLFISFATSGQWAIYVN